METATFIILAVIGGSLALAIAIAYFPTQQKRQAPPDEGSFEKEAQGSVVEFRCVGCGSSLRLKTLNKTKKFRCPSCKTDYTIIRQGGESPVLLVMPTLRNESSSRKQQGRQGKTMPPEVRSTLRAFDLDEFATISDVRRVYRERMRQYHPDMVSHLGPKLRAVAEEESKELNRNYELLDRYFRG